jgi:hypothetical protein
MLFSPETVIPDSLLPQTVNTSVAECLVCRPYDSHCVDEAWKRALTEFYGRISANNMLHIMRTQGVDVSEVVAAMAADAREIEVEINCEVED